MATTMAAGVSVGWYWCGREAAAARDKARVELSIIEGERRMICQAGRSQSRLTVRWLNLIDVTDAADAALNDQVRQRGIDQAALLLLWMRYCDGPDRGEALRQRTEAAIDRRDIGALEQALLEFAEVKP